MGVALNEEIVFYTVVIDIPKVRTPSKYYKTFNSAENVVHHVSNLPEAERVVRIFSVNDYGETTLQTVAFENGRLVLTKQNHKEEE